MEARLAAMGWVVLRSAESSFDCSLTDLTKKRAGETSISGECSTAVDFGGHKSPLRGGLVAAR